MKLWNKYLPHIQPYYAVKSNPDKHILELLTRNKVKYDCASPREMYCIINNSSLGEEQKTINNILYANPHKAENDILEAKQLGINKTVIDSVEGIDDILSCRWNPGVYIRITVDDNESSSPFSIKFDAHRQQWKNLIDYIKCKGVHLEGVSFHVGSGSRNPEQYGKAIDSARELFDLCYSNCFYNMKLNIGGGFLPDESNFSNAANSIQNRLTAWKKECAKTFPVEIIAEPGRFFSAPSHTLYVPIIHKKKTLVGYNYVIDESIYGQFSAIPFDHAKPYWKLFEKNTGIEKKYNTNTPHHESIIFGRTCDSIDMIAYSKRMPIMDKGDYLCFPNMGAYTRVSASEFNGFPTPALIYTSDANTITDTNNDVIFPIETISHISLSQLS